MRDSNSGCIIPAIQSQSEAVRERRHAMKRRSALIWIAWAAFAVAWFLPVVEGSTTLPDGLPGWEAFRVAAAPVWPYKDFAYDKWYYAAMAVAGAASNIFFLLCSPWNLARAPRTVLRVAAWIGVAAFVNNAHWYILFGKDRSDLKIGYFLWWFSFAVLARGLFDVSRESRSGEEKSEAAAGGR